MKNACRKRKFNRIDYRWSPRKTPSFPAKVSIALHYRRDSQLLPYLRSIRINLRIVTHSIETVTTEEWLLTW